MPLSPADREKIRQLADAAWTATAAQISAYTTELGAEERFILDVFDAEGAGEPGVSLDLAPRVIAHYTLDPRAIGIERNVANASKKAALALRTGKDSGVAVEYFPELLEESDFRRPGSILATIDGKRIGFAASGLRGEEDAAFSTLFMSRIVRALLSAAASTATR